MLIPVRCFTCGFPVAEYYDEYKKKIKSTEDGGEGKTAEQALDDLNVTRLCCRRMFVANVDLIDEILPYPRF